jgi:hypothetical protein
MTEVCCECFGAKAPGAQGKCMGPRASGSEMPFVGSHLSQGPSPNVRAEIASVKVAHGRSVATDKRGRCSRSPIRLRYSLKATASP